MSVYMANLPQGTSELYDLLGGLTHPSQATDAIDAAASPTPPVPEKIPEPTPDAPKKPSRAATFIREVWVYALIFILSLVFYFVVVTNSFSGLVNTVAQLLPGSAKTAQQQTQQVQSQAAATQTVKLTSAQAAAYNAWIASYFYDVSDPSITDPNSDISGNGLTNYQKFLLGLNPRVQTSMVGSSMTDSQALIAGIDPLTGGPLTAQQKQTIAANIDLEEVSNRLTLGAMQGSQNSAPEVAGASTTFGAPGTAGVTPIAAGSSAPLRGDGTIDQTQPGLLKIPSLGITVPLIWTQNANDFLKDLPNGVVHYPGTAMPGDTGTSYISGHSSNYSWIKGNYNKVFATLNNLKQYDSFSITVHDTDGKTVTYDYAVDDKGIFTATDQQQFASYDGKSTVALSTCWPVGTSQNRLVVFGELTQVEQ